MVLKEEFKSNFRVNGISHELADPGRLGCSHSLLPAPSIFSFLSDLLTSAMEIQGNPIERTPWLISAYNATSIIAPLTILAHHIRSPLKFNLGIPI